MKLLPDQTEDPPHLRGPLAVTVALAFIFLPLIEQLSWGTILRILFLFAACFISVYDASQWAVKRSRAILQKTLDKIVLDDVLSAIFHPETGLIAIGITTFWGNAAMYALPTTTEQRVHLVQNALDGTGLIDETSSENATARAERILREPGGVSLLFPVVLQNWLSDGKPNTTARSLDFSISKDAASNTPIISGSEDLC